MASLLYLLFLPVLILASDMELQAPTYSGSLPSGIDGGFAARLDSGHSQYLMSRRGGMLVAFALDDGRFVPRCSLPLPVPFAAPYGGSPLATGSIVAAGDVDGDGLDEVVVAANRTIRKYELIRGAFGLTAEGTVGLDSNARPAWCFDICIGDVNRDSINEVLLAGIRSLPRFEPDRTDRPVSLFVCRWTGKDLIQLWNDGRALGLDGPSWVCPISRMVGVCDPTNSGHQRLLVEQGRSDVRASVFDELRWTPDGLHSPGYFIIRDTLIQRNVPDDNPVGSAIRCDFAQGGGKTLILASMLRDDNQWLGECFAFRGDTAAEHRVLWSDDDFDWWRPSAGVIIDLDGRGTGVLRFRHPRPNDGRPGFEFYRL